jgi:hypothetical protein
MTKLDWVESDMCNSRRVGKAKMRVRYFIGICCAFCIVLVSFRPVTSRVILVVGTPVSCEYKNSYITLNRSWRLQHTEQIMAATTWLVGESASTLNVNIKCSRTKYNEISKQHEESNSVISGDSILEI